MLFKVVVTVLVLSNAPVDVHGNKLDHMTFEKDDFPDKATCELSVKQLVTDLRARFSHMRLEVEFKVGDCEPAGTDA